MRDQPAVLFVCLGNICRSPLAEAAFRREMERSGTQLSVDSAGTGRWHVGSAPDPRARAVARRHGVDISHHRARQVEARDFDRFTHIVAMDADNLAALRSLRPRSARAALSLLLDHVDGRHGQPVADPYYGNASDFETTWVDVSQGAAALVQELMAWTPIDSR